MIKQNVPSQAQGTSLRLRYFESHGGRVAPALKIRDHLTDGGKLDTDSITRLANELSIPEATVRGIASYYADLDNPDEQWLVCEGTSCHLADGANVRKQLEAQGKKCKAVSCLGYCDRSPAVLGKEDIPFVRVTANELSKTSEPLPAVSSICKQNIVTSRINQHAQLLENARSLGAYTALEQALRSAPGDVLDAMELSGLRGRGGAAFPTGKKWRLCADTPVSQRYVIANGDEGDPGSFIDRVLMEQDPHGILEGMLLCAYAIGASKGVVYIRSEYPRAIKIMEAAIREASEAGWLGKNICGSDFTFDVSIFPGMGSYVCGEETAMINAIEGLRGEVQIRPPFPTQQGLYGMPTVVNNVETLINVPFIVREGVKAYRVLGTNFSCGTKAICLNHGFAKPGIIEVEFGIPLRRVIEELGGGSHDGKPLAAVILGGPMGSLVMPEDWHTPLCYQAMEQRGIQLGHAGILAVSEDTNFSALLDHWIQFMIDESCGKCVPCRLGSQCASNTMKHSQNTAKIKTRLDQIFHAMEQGSLCAFGQFMPGPMRQIIDNFGDEVFQNLTKK